MTTIEQAIKEAVEKGAYYTDFFEHEGLASLSDIWLDLLFWQALGKARGWRMHDALNKENDRVDRSEAWPHYWHRFIDHLAEGKNAEEFFASLV